ncbi:MAG: M20 family metallopeptidase [Bacillota bacterium]
MGDLRDILELAEGSEPRLREAREEFHRHPELSGEEYWTSEKIEEFLREIGCEIMDLGLETGVVARIPGNPQKPVVALRADIDALPLTEKTGLDYASEYPGLMHACGHDVHISWGLGAAMILSELPPDSIGEVRLLFQPSEEKTSGAKKLIEAGALKGVDYIFGGHNKPDLPAGTVGVSEGYLMATSGRFAFRIVGKGGHGALPHLTRDPIAALAATLSGINTVVSRNVDPLDSAVISVGTVQAGTVGNIIPPDAEVSGTLRSLKSEVADLVERRLREVVDAAALGHECEIEWQKLERGVPAVDNHPEATALAREAASKLLGDDKVVEAVPVMASEDFALYQREVPGCFMWIGSGHSEDPEGPGWHHPEFYPSPACVPVGAAILAASAVTVFESKT